MRNLRALFDRVDMNIKNWMACFGIVFLRVSLGIVFFWFGVLKFFPGLSPAQDLATRTIDVLTFGLIPPNVSILVLAIWECLIGVGLILGVFMRATLLLFFLQMLGTITPMFFFTQEVFAHIPYAPTLEGQYIIKNIVFISAGLVIGGTLRKDEKALLDITRNAWRGLLASHLRPGRRVWQREAERSGSGVSNNPAKVGRADKT